MSHSDKMKRAIAFYFSVLLYLIALPTLLSFSLGYKIDFKALKIHRTGIIYINSSPSAAYVYINEKLHPNLTPTQIEELKPGTYRIEVRREGFYPWETELTVRPNMVTRADHIVLFPITKGLKEIGGYAITDFAVSGKNYIYYFTKYGLLRSDMEGNDPRKLSAYSNWPDGIIGTDFSPDENKLLYFTEGNVYVVYLNPDKALALERKNARIEEVFTTEDAIVNVFWYSGSSYVIVVTKKDIRVVELRGGEKRNIVTLYKFNAHPASLYYDKDNDSLYFTDRKGGSDTKEGRQLYRLDLRQKFFDTLMKLLIKEEA